MQMMSCGNRSRNSEAVRWCLGAVVLALAACHGGERGAPDAGQIDAPVSTVFHVARDGNDANDGTSEPVASLDRAIELASRHHEITDIELASGTYPARDGGTGAYVIPFSVARVAGPPGGGARLVGTGIAVQGSGVRMYGGRIENLELDSFGAAIQAVGTVSIANIRITNSGVGIRGALDFDQNRPLALQIDNIDIARGDTATSRCIGGISLEAHGEVIITGLTMHAVGIAIAGPLDGNAPAPRIDVTGANIQATGDSSVCNSAVLPLGGSAFTLRDSVVEGGFFGIDSYSRATVTIKHSTLRNQAVGVIGDGSVEMTDTTITGMGTALLPGAGRWVLTGVSVTDNGSALDFEGGRPSAPLTLTMHGSTISRNRRDGIKISGDVDADLGTLTSLGNNVITANAGVGLNVVAATTLARVTAVGNTWNAGIQDADSEGQYIIVNTLTGPMAVGAGNNFALAAGTVLQR
jgi:hypothetical protein